ncbi:zinc-ribbon domain-containing protein [Massilia sp. TS11]|uniref:zinc-ribbon domain-containing protein n=1 Tax=Massilia sp. TS11 TaxID=2908003 RepID=UPI001EDADEA5|nr:zinc ribbon domain-containing protein [Massilia sp. TS11]MCG2586528.1 hypothetical protein [Massilia sp. TS11]
MAMLKCSECGNEYSSTARACPSCGARPKKFKWWLWLPIALVVLFLGFGATLSDTPEARAKFADRKAIELCWEDQAKKSNTPVAARTIAGFCEKMEADFKAKYGVSP